MEKFEQKAKEIIKYKKAESGEIGMADFEIVEKYGGIDYVLEIKNWAEGDKEYDKVFQQAVRSAIDNAGSEAFRSGIKEDKDAHHQYMNAKEFLDGLKFILSEKVLEKCKPKLKVKNHFGEETTAEFKQ